MQNRGPIMIIFAASLVLSPLAILAVSERQAAVEAPGQVRTIGQSAQECAAETIQTQTLTIGCGARVSNSTPRREAAGGAMFVSARN